MASGTYVKAPGESRFLKHKLNDRQLKAFAMMYTSAEYSIKQIEERFNISHNVILNLAKDLNLPLRKGGR